jgi:hypothetical protein
MGEIKSKGTLTIMAGLAMAVCFGALIFYPSLRGPNVYSFLFLFLVTALFYILSCLRLDRDRIPLLVIWGFAIFFRLLLLFTSPTLSDDVYRYIWDGYLAGSGINPYALPVNSALLNEFDTPLRALVNNPWMASPYLPAAQAYFIAVNRLLPQNPLAFQISAVLLDLGTGWLIMDMLKLLNSHRRRVLIYLWNPLVVLEFAHGAHVDALMLFLMAASFWLLVRARPGDSQKSMRLSISALSLAAASLTKPIPALVSPLFIRRWGWLRLLIYMLLLSGIIAVFGYSSGFGITGELDGSGLFGALRIYALHWNYNSGFYHWLETLLSGYRTPGAVPVELVGEGPIRFAKGISLFLIMVSTVAAAALAWKFDDPLKSGFHQRSINLLRLALIPLGAYLLFTTTVHPWYVTVILPFLPFLPPRAGEKSNLGRFIWPWIYLSCSIALSYTTYADPGNLREYYQIRQLEYIPFYLLLGWAFYPYLARRASFLKKRG